MLRLDAFSCRPAGRPSVVLESNGLRLEVLVERLLSEILAEPGHFESAEGSRNVCLVVSVDETSAGVDSIRDVKRLEKDAICTTQQY